MTVAKARTYIVDHKDLVGDLGSAHDRGEGSLLEFGVEDFRESFELLGNKEAGDTGHLALHAHHGGVGPVSGTEGVTHVHIAKLGERPAECGDRLFSGLDLLSVLLSLALLLGVKAHVLKDNDGALGRIGARSLDLCPDAV